MNEIEDVEVKKVIPNQILDLTPKNVYETKPNEDSFDYFSPERHANESFDQYKLRRDAVNHRTRNIVKMGKVLWNSGEKGSYNKKLHGELV